MQEFPAWMANTSGATIATAMGALLVMMGRMIKGWLFWRERSSAISAKRLKPLDDLLRQEDLETISPVRLELVFRSAMGYALASDDLRFALRRENTLKLLRALRIARGSVDRVADGYCSRRRIPTWLLEAFAALLAGGGTGFALLCIAFAWTTHSPGWYAVALESVAIVWMGVSGGRTASAVRFLANVRAYPSAPAQAHRGSRLSPRDPADKPRAKKGKKGSAATEADAAPLSLVSERPPAATGTGD